MSSAKKGKWVLGYECFGFGLILLLTWLNELTNLPAALTAGARVSDVRYSIIETAVILVIWAVVFLLTRRLLAHLYYLEGFVRVCAWCRKVGYQGKWMRLEDYFSEGFNIATTHGMCPECLKKVEEDTKRFYRAELNKRTASEMSVAGTTPDPRAGTTAPALTPLPPPTTQSEAQPDHQEEAA